MTILGIQIGGALLALLALLLAFRFLWNSRWVLSWLKGTVGLLALVIALLCVSLAFDISGYRAWDRDNAIASIQFERLGEQHYRATLKTPNETEQQFDIQGDQWQIDARVLAWKAPLPQWGVKPIFQLNRLSGRYFTLEQERNSPRSVYDLRAASVGVDAWKAFHRLRTVLPLLAPQYGSATFLPMAHGAAYQLQLAATGIVAVPDNEAAEQVLAAW